MDKINIDDLLDPLKKAIHEASLTFTDFNLKETDDPHQIIDVVLYLIKKFIVFEENHRREIECLKRALDNSEIIIQTQTHLIEKIMESSK